MARCAGVRCSPWPQALAPIRALPRFAGPVLVIGGEQDRSTTPAETARMYAAVTGPRSLWMAPGADHEATAGLERDAYRAVLLAFLRRTIGAPRG